jgi:hypothetical protein
MFGPIIIFICAVAIVATYIFIVNRLLRSDEHWNENAASLATAPRVRETKAAATETGHGVLALN